jgi:glycosyltransferase involved in cell wall biosynthesis
VTAATSKVIAFLLPNLGGGGAERVALTLAKAFIGRGQEVDLVVMERTGELLDAVPAGVRIVDLGVKRMRGVIPPLIRYLRQRRPDAIQISMWPLTIMGIIAARLSRVPMRVVVSDHVAYSAPFLNSRQLRLLGWSARLIYPLADHRVVVSERGADDLAALTGIARSRLEVVYNPIDVPRTIASSDVAERAWRGPGRRIISTGALKPQKNHALLLRTFARLQEKDVQLVILGEGPLRAELERLAADLGIADRVAMPGFRVDPWPYLASAEMFVLSSDYEGYPLALAEAMHAGLRIVSTDCVSGPSEMLDGGRFGKLVPVGDERALAEAIEEGLRRPHSPDLVRERAQSVSGAGVVDQYLDLLIGSQ